MAIISRAEIDLFLTHYEETFPVRRRRGRVNIYLGQHRVRSEFITTTDENKKAVQNMFQKGSFQSDLIPEPDRKYGSQTAILRQNFRFSQDRRRSIINKYQDAAHFIQEKMKNWKPKQNPNYDPEVQKQLNIIHLKSLYENLKYSAETGRLYKVQREDEENIEEGHTIKVQVTKEMEELENLPIPEVVNSQYREHCFHFLDCCLFCQQSKKENWVVHGSQQLINVQEFKGESI